MPVPKPAAVALKTWRRTFGEGTVIERWVRDRYVKSMSNEVTKERGPGWVQYSTQSAVVISESDDFPEPRRGIVLKGGCDMPAVFTMAPLAREGIKGTLAIARIGGGTGSHRSDQMLQTLDDLPADAVEETVQMLKMAEDSFEPTFFEPTFVINGLPAAGEFHKDVVVLSIASDETRQVYRHRELGFLADPGGWWLNQDLDRVLDDLSAVDWFRQNFKRVGRMSVDDFRKNNARLVREVRDRIGGEVLFFNTMVVDPANPTHNYQLVKTAHSVRRREFTIALAELSREIDVPIVDIDRLLKSTGVDEQVDFAHFPVDRMAPIGAEVYRILSEKGLAV